MAATLSQVSSSRALPPSAQRLELEAPRWKSRAQGQGVVGQGHVELATGGVAHVAEAGLGVAEVGEGVEGLLVAVEVISPLCTWRNSPQGVRRRASAVWKAQSVWLETPMS
ncbi:MAG: hypothetical protein QM757_35240 [Paludibaculum sp.]